MAMDQKWNMLFIRDERSMFDAETKAFDKLFNSVDKATGRE